MRIDLALSKNRFCAYMTIKLKPNGLPKFPIKNKLHVIMSGSNMVLTYDKLQITQFMEFQLSIVYAEMRKNDNEKCNVCI